jgi:hypothetical protein
MAKRYIIVKWWPRFPEYKQPANQTMFATREKAERVKNELVKAMPDRCFEVKEL